jgi:hypothetical protein
MEPERPRTFGQCCTARPAAYAPPASMRLCAGLLTEMRPHRAEVSTRRESGWSAVLSWVPVTTVTELWRDTASGETHVRAFDDRRILITGPMVRAPQPYNGYQIVERPRARGGGGDGPAARALPAEPRSTHAVTEAQYLAMPGVVAGGGAEWL